MTNVVISQPMYFPWPGFYDQMRKADRFVWLDDVQFSRGSYTNRIQVKTGDESTWMTIPLVKKGSHVAIKLLESVENGWRESHASLLRQQIGHRSFTRDALSIVDDVMSRSPLVDLLIASCELPAAYLGIRPQFSRSSELDAKGESWKRVLAICRELGATTYITGHGASKYLDHEAFENAGIDVQYMDYSVKKWDQKGKEFTPFVTILDLISEVGSNAGNHFASKTENWKTFLDRKISQTG